MLRALLNKIMFMHDPIGFVKAEGVKIGDNCSILGTTSPFGSEPYLISIGNHVRINNGVQFVTHDGSVWVLRELAKKGILPKEIEKSDLFGVITVGNNVQIGSNAMILPNVCIGNNVIIGAGSIVTKDIPDNSVAVGIPARVIESIDDYYEKNKSLFEYTKGMVESEKRNYLTQKYNLL